MPEPLAYLNGQFVRLSEMAISIADAGFVYGATATEFLRTFRGKLFRLDDHLARLRESCRLCRIPLAASSTELAEAAQKLIEKNLGNGVAPELCLIIFSTPGPLAHYGHSESGPTLGMHTFPLPVERYRRLFAEGARLVVPPIRQPAAVDPRAKMRSRLHWWIAEHQAREVDPNAWALLLDSQGFVTETAAANFAIVQSGTVVSPPRTSILNGISLNVTQELCCKLGIPFVERRLSLAECQQGVEAFLTGTAFCLAGVRSIAGAQLPWPGPTTRRLLAAWNELSGLDVEGQFIGQQN